MDEHSTLNVMPYRTTPLCNEYVYHVYNRGVGKGRTFVQPREYIRFLSVLEYYRFVQPPIRYSYYTKYSEKDRQRILLDLEKSEKYVDIIAFVLMPNHFHLLLKQVHDNGVSIFMRKVADSYTKYINTKWKRSGYLFESHFKAVRIETDEQLVHVSRYIHLNPFCAGLCTLKSMITYPWSSLITYCGSSKDPIINTDRLAAFFPDYSAYKQFVTDQADYALSLKEMQKNTIRYCYLIYQE